MDGQQNSGDGTSMNLGNISMIDAIRSQPGDGSVVSFDFPSISKHGRRLLKAMNRMIKSVSSTSDGIALQDFPNHSLAAQQDLIDFEKNPVLPSSNTILEADVTTLDPWDSILLGVPDPSPQLSSQQDVFFRHALHVSLTDQPIKVIHKPIKLVECTKNDSFHSKSIVTNAELLNAKEHCMEFKALQHHIAPSLSKMNETQPLCTSILQLPIMQCRQTNSTSETQLQHLPTFLSKLEETHHHHIKTESQMIQDHPDQLFQLPLNHHLPAMSPLEPQIVQHHSTTPFTSNPLLKRNHAMTSISKPQKVQQNSSISSILKPQKMQHNHSVFSKQVLQHHPVITTSKVHTVQYHPTCSFMEAEASSSVSTSKSEIIQGIPTNFTSKLQRMRHHHVTSASELPAIQHHCIFSLSASPAMQHHYVTSASETQVVPSYFYSSVTGLQVKQHYPNTSASETEVIDYHQVNSKSEPHQPITCTSQLQVIKDHCSFSVASNFSQLRLHQLEKTPMQHKLIFTNDFLPLTSTCKPATHIDAPDHVSELDVENCLSSFTVPNLCIDPFLNFLPAACCVKTSEKQSVEIDACFLSAEVTACSLSADTTAYSLSVDTTVCSLSAGTAACSQSANTAACSLPTDATVFSLPTDTAAYSLSADTTVCSQSADTTVYSLSADAASFSLLMDTAACSLFADTTACSLHAITTACSLPVDTTTCSLPFDTASCSLFTDTTAYSLPANTTAGTTDFFLSADTTALSLPAIITACSLLVDTTSCSLSTDKTACSLPASITAGTTAFSLSADTTACSLSGNVTVCSLPAVTTSCSLPAGTTICSVPADTTACSLPADTVACSLPSDATVHNEIVCLSKCPVVHSSGAIQDNFYSIQSDLSQNRNSLLLPCNSFVDLQNNLSVSSSQLSSQHLTLKLMLYVLHEDHESILEVCQMYILFTSSFLLNSTVNFPHNA